MNLVSRLAEQLRTLRAVRAQLAELERAVSRGDLAAVHLAIGRVEEAAELAGTAYDGLASALRAFQTGVRSGAGADDRSLAQLQREVEAELARLREQRTRTLYLLETLFTLNHHLVVAVQEQLAAGTDYAHRRAVELEEQRLIDASA